VHLKLFSTSVPWSRSSLEVPKGLYKPSRRQPPAYQTTWRFPTIGPRLIRHEPLARMLFRLETRETLAKEAPVDLPDSRGSRIGWPLNLCVQRRRYDQSHIVRPRAGGTSHCFKGWGNRQAPGMPNWRWGFGHCLLSALQQMQPRLCTRQRAAVSDSATWFGSAVQTTVDKL
jgi:hypothetical protein